jgi:hypothetical protein
MATRTYRDMRRTLPVLLVLMLAFVLGAQSVRHSTAPGRPSVASASATGTTAHAAADASEAAPAEAKAAVVLPADRARVLRTQLVVSVRASRAPPAVLR